MSRETEPFDPELEGLLREIAADPRSSLLRVPRARTPAALLESPSAVRATATGLTVAERHLLEVHRDELADVLRRACLMRFFADPDRAIYLNRSRSAGQELEIDTPEQWRERARAALADARRAPAPLEGLDLLEACLRPAPCLRPARREPLTITQLARASQRLQPTDVAEAYVGLDLVLSGETPSGISLMRALLERSPTGYVRSCVLENLGYAYSNTNRLSWAQECYRDAARVCTGRPSALVGWLLLSVQLGDRDGVLESGKQLDSNPSAHQSVVTELAAKYRAQMERGDLEASRHSRPFARLVRDQLGSVSQEVALVFA